MDRFSRKKIYLQGLDIKKNILKGREFRGGSGRKMRKMWLGWEIVVDFPSLAHQWQEIEIGFTISRTCLHSFLIFSSQICRFKSIDEY